MTPDDQRTEADADVRAPGEKNRHTAGPSVGWFRRTVEVVGLLPPASGSDPYAHRRGEPRGLAALWLFFLLAGSGVVYASLGTPNLASAEGYRFASKVLLTTVGIGVMVLWPMLRLSQMPPASGGVPATARDLVVILVPVQAFYWPQVLLTGWDLESLALAAVVMAAWTLLAGAVIAMALGPAESSAKRYGQGVDGSTRVAARAVWMLVLVALPLIAPLGMLAASAQADSEDRAAVRQVLAMCSPYTAHWEILVDRVWTGSRSVVEPLHWRIAVLSLLAGVAAWAVAFVLTRSEPVVRRSLRA